MQISEILREDQCLGKEHYYPCNVFIVSKINFPEARVSAEQHCVARLVVMKSGLAWGENAASVGYA